MNKEQDNTGQETQEQYPYQRGSNNSGRAQRIRSICFAYEDACGLGSYLGNSSLEETLIDMLTDMRHLCEVEDLGFENLLEHSEYHFNYEKAGKAEILPTSHRDCESHDLENSPTEQVTKKSSNEQAREFFSEFIWSELRVMFDGLKRYYHDLHPQISTRKLDPYPSETEDKETFKVAVTVRETESCKHGDRIKLEDFYGFYEDLRSKILEWISAVIDRTESEMAKLREQNEQLAEDLEQRERAVGDLIERNGELEEQNDELSSAIFGRSRGLVRHKGYSNEEIWKMFGPYMKTGDTTGLIPREVRLIESAIDRDETIRSLENQLEELRYKESRSSSQDKPCEPQIYGPGSQPSDPDEVEPDYSAVFEKLVKEYLEKREFRDLVARATHDSE